MYYKYAAEVAFVTDMDEKLAKILKKASGLDPLALGGLLVLLTRQSLLPLYLLYIY